MEIINTGDDTEQSTFDLEGQKRKARKSAYWTMGWGIGVVTLFVLLVSFDDDWHFIDLFHNIFFVFGVLLLGSGIWELRNAWKLTPEDFEVDERSQKITEAIKNTDAIYTKIIIGCLIVVAVFQLITRESVSIQAAGLVKDAVREGESWRLLTCITLHGNLGHLWMNCYALYGIGKVIEYLSNRAYIAIIFLISGICGSVFSLVLIPNTTSVGASGGIMGLIGFLAVFAYKREEDVPTDFFKRILTSIAIIGLIGLVGFAIIDNAGHLGGLLAGAAIGGLLIKRSDDSESTYINKVIPILGYVSMLVIIGISVFSIMKIVK